MKTLETDVAEDGARERSPDPEATEIWEEKYWSGELEPKLLQALKEKFGPAGDVLVEGAAADPKNLRPSNERQILVDQLVNVNRRLQRRVEAQHDELSQQSRRLAAANRAKDLLLTRTGHDIKNGIGSILAHTTLAWASAGGAASEQLDNIEETCQHLLQLLDTLVDQAALASGAFSVRPMSFGLEELMSSVARDLREGRLRRKGQELILPDLEDAHVVHADPQRITQVLRNYLENASKFAHSGTTIEIRVTAKDKAVAVEILDEGPGIPESSLARLFEPMADIGNSPTDGEPSTGVGLPVIADIVHRHGGEVWGRNRQGGGAAFGFSLPILSDKDSEPLTWSMS